jgi:hypothetical protein
MFSEAARRYRKRPAVIEAVQLTWSNWGEIRDFVSKEAFGRGVWLDAEGNPTATSRFGKDNDDLGLLLNTLEGEMLARGNDWIIKGVKGEFYPCKPDIFAATYEKA